MTDQNSAVQEPLTLYTEITPNPESLKFVVNRMLLANDSADIPDKAVAKRAPIAAALFEFPFVKGVFIAQNFVTVTKDVSYQWEDLIPQLKNFIQEYVEAGKPLVDEGFSTTIDAVEDDTDDVKKIKELLDNYIKPAVEMDGGAIQFKSYEEGVVTLQLQGSCAGCPASSVTLKAGIEGLFQRMLPQVKEVIAEDI